MIRPFRRRPTPQTPAAGPVRIVIDRIELPEIRHVIERKMPPRPTVIQPMGWLTGRAADNAVQCSMRLELHYDPR